MNVELNRNEVSYIYSILCKQPYEQSAVVIEKIKSQYLEQQDDKKESKEY